MKKNKFVVGLFLILLGIALSVPGFGMFVPNIQPQLVGSSNINYDSSLLKKSPFEIGLGSKDTVFIKDQAEERYKAPIFIGPQKELAKCKAQILIYNAITILQQLDQEYVENIDKQEEKQNLKDSVQILLDNWENKKFKDYVSDGADVDCHISLVKDDNDKNLMKIFKKYANTALRDKETEYRYADAILFPSKFGDKWSYEENINFIRQAVIDGRPVVLLNSLKKQIESDEYWQKSRELSGVIDELFWLVDFGYKLVNLKGGHVGLFPPKREVGIGNVFFDFENYRIDKSLSQTMFDKMLQKRANKISTDLIFCRALDVPTGLIKFLQDSTTTFFQTVNIKP